MTAWATIELAVDAMKRGARDFVTKPWDNQRLLTIVRTQIELAAALRRERKLEAENEMLRGTMPDLIAQSPTMRPVVEMISRVAPSDANVLITGENGTGKSLIAQAIHALSPRATPNHDHRQHGRPVRDTIRERTVRTRKRRVY